MTYTMDQLPLVYVAAPYTRPEPVENAHLAIKMGTRLAATGLVTPHVPHATLAWHLVDPHPPAFWYEYDMAALVRCDGLLRMPGESWGADREVERAQDEHLPVFHNVEDLLMAAEQLQAIARVAGVTPRESCRLGFGLVVPPCS